MFYFGKKGVSNLFIHDAINRIRKTKEYKGIYSSNNINKKLNKVSNFCIVVNLNKRAKRNKGHFIVIHASSNRILYFDPLGNPCYVKSIFKFMKKCKRPIFHNLNQIQDMNSIYCGLYCILFTLYFDRKKPFKMIFYKRRNKLKKNDEKCIKYLKKLV